MEGSRRTIVFVDNSTGLTGGFKSMIHVIRKLSDKYAIVVVTPDKEFASTHLPEVTCYQIPFLEIQKSWKLLLYPFMLLRNTLRLKEIVRAQANPVLHMNDFYNLTGCGVKLLSKQTPLVYHVRLLPTSYIGAIYSWLSRIVSRYADAIICCSKAVYNSLPESGKKQVIYDAMEPPAAITEEKMAPPEILYLANYIPGKGHEFALDIFKHLAGLNSQVTLKFIGGTLGKQSNEEYRDQLVMAAKELSDRVSFEGFASDVNHVIQRATILLNCSESESFSMVCLEGLFNETCVVTLDSGGPAELIQHGETGLIFRIGTSANIIAAEINQLLGNETAQREMTRKGKSFAQENFTQQDTIGEIEKVYSLL